MTRDERRMWQEERRLWQDLANGLLGRLDRIAAALEVIADAERRGAEAALSMSAKEWQAVADTIAAITGREQVNNGKAEIEKLLTPGTGPDKAKGKK